MKGWLAMKGIACVTLAVGLLNGAVVGLGDHKDLPSNLKKASELIGTKVENPNGDNLGQIEDVVLDTNNGRVAYAVLSFGGFLGIGDKLFAIPWQALRENPEKKICLLAVDKETLKSAPGFDKKNWPNMADAQWQSQIETFYKEPLLAARMRTLDVGTVQRESTDMPLRLRQGSTINYKVTCDREREIRLKVLNASAEESTVQVTCTGDGVASDATGYTVRVAKDGTVRSDARPDDPNAPATKPESRTEPRPGSGKAELTREQQIMVLNHIFGQGLHAQKLEPGKDYAVTGGFSSFGPLAESRAGIQGGTPERSTAPAGGTPTPSSAKEGPASVRFDGVGKYQGENVAVFTVALPRSEPRTTDPNARPATPADPTRPGSIADAGRITARTLYRISDGLVEACEGPGVSLRRSDTTDLGN